MTGKVIKILSIVTSIAGCAVALVSDYVQNKRLDGVIAEKVSEAVAKINK